MSFLGNVTVGADISLASLRLQYDGVNHLISSAHLCSIVSCREIGVEAYSLTCMWLLQVVLAYGAENNRKLNIPGEVQEPPHLFCTTRIKFLKAQKPTADMPVSCQHTMHELNTCCGMQDLKNSLSAREFVWWYNGHPDYAKLQIDLSKVMDCVQSIL